ncbi:MAG: hypothetical protein IKU45_00340 [Clostridia bacterium]|nr:hypothetical protein [Clostridia bacterium]
MEIDKRQIMNKLDAIGDEDLKNMVKMIAEGAGMSKGRAERAVSDISKLRKNIGSLSEKDLKNALSMLDDDTVENIKRQMNM